MATVPDPIPRPRGDIESRWPGWCECQLIPRLPSCRLFDLDACAGYMFDVPSSPAPAARPREFPVESKCVCDQALDIIASHYVFHDSRRVAPIERLQDLLNDAFVTQLRFPQSDSRVSRSRSTTNLIPWCLLNQSTGFAFVVHAPAHLHMGYINLQERLPVQAVPPRGVKTLDIFLGVKSANPGTLSLGFAFQ